MEQKCKHCARKTSLSDEDIAKMVQQVTSMRGVKLVDAHEYQRRFEICKSCESFAEGSTCLLCGCVMQVRARLADGRCPAPKGGRW